MANATGPLYDAYVGGIDKLEVRGIERCQLIGRKVFDEPVGGRGQGITANLGPIGWYWNVGVFFARAVFFAAVTRGAGLLGQEWVCRLNALMAVSARIDIAYVFPIERVARGEVEGRDGK
jgi:hypothetical protein